MSKNKKHPPEHGRDESTLVAGAIIGLALGAAAAGAAMLGAWLALGEAVTGDPP
jgi:hypothetical protein